MEISTSRIGSYLLELPNLLSTSEAMVPSLRLSRRSYGGNTKNRPGFLPAPREQQLTLTESEWNV